MDDLDLAAGAGAGEEAWGASAASHAVFVAAALTAHAASSAASDSQRAREAAASAVG